MQNIDFVHIKALLFKNVANLVVKNVTMFTFDNQAFDNLEADKIHFTDVTFNNDSTMGTFRPRLIRSALEFANSFIPNEMPIQINQPNVTGLTVGFRNCHFYGPSLLSDQSKIRADHVHITTNNFSQVAQNKIPVEFGQSLNVNGNALVNLRMPDIRFNLKEMNVAGEMDISFANRNKTNENAAAAAKKWLDSFNFVFKGDTIQSKEKMNANSCSKEKWSWKDSTPKYNIQCPNIEAMKILINSHRFESLYANRPTGGPDSSASSVSFSSFTLLSLLFIISNFPTH